MSEKLDMAKMQAKRLKKIIDNSDVVITSQDSKEVITAINKTIKATSEDEVPSQIGGDLYFKSNTLSKKLEVDDFSSQFRKIHVLLGRDIDMERRHIEYEENSDLNSIELRELDEKSR